MDVGVNPPAFCWQSGSSWTFSVCLILNLQMLEHVSLYKHHFSAGQFPWSTCLKPAVRKPAGARCRLSEVWPPSDETWVKTDWSSLQSSEPDGKQEAPRLSGEIHHLVVLLCLHTLMFTVSHSPSFCLSSFQGEALLFWRSLLEIKWMWRRRSCRAARHSLLSPLCFYVSSFSKVMDVFM